MQLSKMCFVADEKVWVWIIVNPQGHVCRGVFFYINRDVILGNLKQPTLLELELLSIIERKWKNEKLIIIK